VFLLTLCADAAGQPPAAAGAAAAPSDESMERIRKALDRPVVLELEPRRPDYRAEIVADRFRGNLFGSVDPNWVPPFGRTHYEFLHAVTPRQVENPFSNSELAQVAATSVGVGLAARGLKTLIARQLDARRERRVNEIRLQIERELAELERRRGTPPR
jgi:hypothetical protein